VVLLFLRRLSLGPFRCVTAVPEWIHILRHNLLHKPARTEVIRITYINIVHYSNVTKCIWRPWNINAFTSSLCVCGYTRVELTVQQMWHLCRQTNRSSRWREGLISKHTNGLRTRIWSQVPTGYETKNNCAGEDHEQFAAVLWYPIAPKYPHWTITFSPPLSLQPHNDRKEYALFTREIPQNVKDFSISDDLLCFV
jgi:hypothetical protein